MSKRRRSADYAEENKYEIMSEEGEFRRKTPSGRRKNHYRRYCR